MGNQVQMESGTHELSRGPSVTEVECACDAVDVAVAEVAVCVDILARVAASDDATKASTDARFALKRICGVVDDLRASCQRVRASMNDRVPAIQAHDPIPRRF